MRCLVTGATGPIGSHLVRYLLAHGEEVAVLVRPASDRWRLKEVLGQIHLIPGDLPTICQAGGAIKDFAPEAVFHLAWYGSRGQPRQEAEQIPQNLTTSLELLRLSREAGCRLWLGLGSQAEYGPPRGILSEELPTFPATFYGAVKLSVCLLARRLCEAWEMDFVWLRLLASYGPLDNPGFLIPSVILTLLKGEKPLLTPGEQLWDYLFVDDVAAAIYQTARTPGARGIFNLGSGKVASVRGIVERLRDLIDPGLPLGLGALPYRPGQIMLLQADISRLRQHTGWSPQVELPEGLRRTVEWYRDHRCQYGG